MTIEQEDQALGAAWRRCEAALPQGAEIALVFGLRNGYLARPSVALNMARADDAQWGATPTEALTALAEALEKRETDLYASNMEWEHEVGS